VPPKKWFSLILPNVLIATNLFLNIAPVPTAAFTKAPKSPNKFLVTPVCIFTRDDYNQKVMKTASDPRHRHRTKLVQHLFSFTYQKQPDPVIQQILDHLSKIDPVIIEIAPEWPLDNLNPADLAILRLALYELMIDKGAPYKVIIDEAIELAKEFGSQSSSSFINGALGKYIQKYESPT